MDKLKLSTASIVILIAGVVMLLGSFLDFTKSKSITVAGFTVRASIGGGNAWSTRSFFIATIPVLIGVVMARTSRSLPSHRKSSCRRRFSG